jgi:hypothetical protein
MSEETRKIDNYGVLAAIHIDGKVVILAEDMASAEPYMVCDCHWDNPLSIDTYDNALAGTDYLEAMDEFLHRVSDAMETVRNRRAERKITDEPLTAADCIPDSNMADYENKLVIIKPERMAASARSADEQLVMAISGNGCNPNARGQAVFCTNLFTGKTTRWDRHDIAGIIKPERIPKWAFQRLTELPSPKEAPPPSGVYMHSFFESRSRNEVSAYWESLHLNESCARSIEQAISNSNDGNHRYDLSSALKAVVSEYSQERINIVLANTLRHREYDGRFSPENKAWAQNISLPNQPAEYRNSYFCESRSAILNGFVNQVRKHERESATKQSVAERLKEQPVAQPKRGASSHDKGR